MLAAAFGSAVVLAVVRSLGPLWLVMIVLACLAVLGLPRAKQVAVRHAALALTGAVVVGGAVVGGLWWTRAAGTNSLETNLHLTDPVGRALASVPLWMLQSVAAFPTRHEAAPAMVYACGLVVIAAVLGLGLAAADRRIRLVLTACLAAAFVVPLVLTVLTVSAADVVWQGRYGMPFMLGLPLLAGLAIEARPGGARSAVPLLTVCWAPVLVAHLVGVIHVQVSESGPTAAAHAAGWHPAPTILVPALTAAGMLVWFLATLRRPARIEAVL